MFVSVRGLRPSRNRTVMGRRRRGTNFPRSTASTSARGYGTSHQAERKRWELVVESGYASCVRCGLPIVAGTGWHLDHRDDKLGYLGVSHARCNVRAAAKLGNQRMREKRALVEPPSSRRGSREW